MQTLQATSGQLAELQTHGYARLRCKQWDAPSRDDNVIVGDMVCHVLMIVDDLHGDETVVSVRIGEKPNASKLG